MLVLRGCVYVLQLRQQSFQHADAQQESPSDPQQQEVRQTTMWGAATYQEAVSQWLNALKTAPEMCTTRDETCTDRACLL